ncbi:hypothetical protein BDN72DRAFT_406680 [Pluteus cervinus]|uniref:Uncharacterized protein n=1 Tax=Pluteus cervinus TaxID=181527 RepID=A0ACD3A8W2_9AGAR|nr:hypothetical protein BDN72DRAFT_406680 [Pluteus cervinus]
MARLSRIGFIRGCGRSSLYFSQGRQSTCKHVKGRIYKNSSTHPRTYVEMEMETPHIRPSIRQPLKRLVVIKLWIGCSVMVNQAICHLRSFGVAGASDIPDMMSPDGTATTHLWTGIATTYTHPNLDRRLCLQTSRSNPHSCFGFPQMILPLVNQDTEDLSSSFTCDRCCLFS